MLQKFVFSVPVDCDTLFSNHKNSYKKKIEKKQRKLLVKIPIIRPFLKNDETVLFICKGHSSISLFDQVFMGWLLLFFKRSLFVFTNKRMFLIPTSIDYSYRGSIARTDFSRCKSLFLKYNSLYAECMSCHQKDRYTGFKSSDRKKIKAILETLTFNDASDRSPHQAHLCPQCTAPLEPNHYTCNKCGLEFKNETMARVFSLLLPGGGYFYTRKRFLGIVNGFIELLLLGGMGFGVYSLVEGDKKGWVYLLACMVPFFIKKIIAMSLSTGFINEFIPKIKSVKPRE